jgi:hypothetical protein
MHTPTRIEKARLNHRFNLEGTLAEANNLPIDIELICNGTEVKVKDAHFDISTWRKLLYLAALNESHPLGHLRALVEEIIEQKLSNEQELGKLIRKRMIEEAHDVSHLYRQARREKLQELGETLEDCEISD